MMRKFVYLATIVAATISVPLLQAETADDFLKAYFLIQDGDTAEKGSDNGKAVEKYSSALEILRDIKRTSPDWNPNIITYRLKYCAEHIIKDGGKVPTEKAPEAGDLGDPRPPINTVPPGATPTTYPVEVEPSNPTPPAPTTSGYSPTVTTPPTPTETQPPDAGPDISDRVSRLERDLEDARNQIRRLQEQKSDLETRLKKTEEDLRAADAGGDERVQSLLKENSSLKKQLAETEERLSSMSTGSEDIAQFKADLARTRATLDAAQRENESLRTANEALKRELDDARVQLRTGAAPAGVGAEELKMLQKENALLRSIVERQFRQDAERMAARDALTKELKELSARTEVIRSQIDILGKPLTPLNEEERRILRTPGVAIRASDSSRMEGVITSSRGGGAAPTTRLTGNNALVETEAKRLFAKGDLQGAAAKYEQILQSEPNSLLALSNLAVIRFRQDQVEDAEKILQNALNLDPQDSFSLSVMGIVKYKQNKLDDAVRNLTHALTIDPNNHETHNFLGITYSQKGWLDAAEKELLKAIELDPGYGEAHFNLAFVFASQNPPSVELARKHYKKALELGVEKDPELEKLLKK